jgi:signal transduction histidine kinase
VRTLSLKTRIRLSVLLFLLSVVVGFAVLHVTYLLREKFDRVEDTVNLTVQYAKAKVQERLQQRLQETKIVPTSIESLRDLTERVIREDEIALNDSLAKSFSESQTVLSVSLIGRESMVLASSDPTAVGKKSASAPDFYEWMKRGRLQKVVDIYRNSNDYSVLVPIGLRGGSDVLVNVQVQVGAVLLNKHVFPDLLTILGYTLLAIALSAVAAILVSRWATRPLTTIMDQIEMVTAGQNTKTQQFETKELAAVQSKLDVLGQRVRGAQESATALRSNFEQMIERLEEAVMLFDKNGVLILCGQPAARLFGRPLDQLLGCELHDLFPETTTAGQALKSAIELNQPVRSLSFPLMDTLGHSVQALMSAENLESFPDLERLGTLVTLRDAESRRELESQLGVTTRLEAISKLMSGVAHEIKNPLNAIALHLEILRGQMKDEESAPSLNVIGREIFRLDRVVKTFLDFTRPVELRVREVDLGALIAEVGALVRPDMDRKGVKLDLRNELGRVAILGDPDLLKQALLNVVVNAVEAMPQGGNLTMELSRQGEHVVLAVTDTGNGIPEDLRQKVFQLYFTTKNGGSGLGLAMTFRAMQLHNGSIEFATQSGGGTTFWLRFPGLNTNSSRVERPAVAYSGN